MKRFLLAALVVGGCANDVFVGGDAGSDAATETGTDGGGTADGQGTCAQPSGCPSGSFCASFDDGTTGPFSDNSAGGGSTQVFSDQRVTCPNALLAKLGAVSVVGNARAVIVKTVTVSDPATAHATFEVEAWLPATTTGAATFITLRPNSDPTAAVTIGTHTDGRWYLDLRASTSSSEIKPLLGAWNHFKLDVVFDASSGMASVMYTDDNAQAQVTSIKSPTLHTAAGSISAIAAQVGIEPVATTTGAMAAYFDDLTFTPN